MEILVPKPMSIWYAVADADIRPFAENAGCVNDKPWRGVPARCCMIGRGVEWPHGYVRSWHVAMMIADHPFALRYLWPEESPLLPGPTQYRFRRITEVRPYREIDFDSLKFMD